METEQRKRVRPKNGRKTAGEDMRKNEKWDFLDEKRITHEISEADVDTLEKLSKDQDSMVRDEAALALGYSNSPRAEMILLKMLYDKCADVRSSVCISLRTRNSAEIVETLKPFSMEDEDYLVRGYTVMGMMEIAINTRIVSDDLIAFLEQGLSKEEEPWVKAAYYYALCIAGKEKYLSLLIDGLNNEDIAGLSANLLLEAVNKENSDAIAAALDDRLKVKNQVAGINWIEHVKKEIQEKILKDV